MPRRKPDVPPYNLHKASGQAYVNGEGRRIYLGLHDRPESRERYRRVLAELDANGGRRAVPPEEITVTEVLDRYLAFAEGYYRCADGTPTQEAAAVKITIRHVRELYGRILAAEFGPLALKAVRQRMLSEGWCRTTLNQNAGRVKRMFRWAVAEELVPPSVIHGLSAVPGLRRGRTEAPEFEPVKPVPEPHIESVKPHVSRQVRGLIELQLFTGARPGELVIMRGGDLDTSGDIWLYTPQHHKGQHHGGQRTIHIGPRGQRVIREFLKGDLSDFLFSPADAEAERRERLHADRVTPPHYGNAPGTNRRPSPKVQPGERYSVDSYRRAIERGCKAAGVLVWSPHRLRHNAATLIRKRFGLESAQCVLGHADADVTQIYAERDAEKARQVIAMVG